MNQIIITGRLTKEPEAYASKDGNTLTRFSIAVNTGKDKVSYFDCSAFHGQADFVTKYLHKGSPVVVRGSMNQSRTEKGTFWNVLVEQVESTKPTELTKSIVKQQGGGMTPGYNPHTTGFGDTDSYC